MQPSSELRWFMEGAIDDKLLAWFETDRLVSHAQGHFTPGIEKRNDKYLHSSQRTDIGIKLRAGEKIEIKKLLQSRDAQSLGPEVEGRIENWVKWSFTLNRESALDPTATSSVDFWIDVQKTRRYRKLAVRPGNAIVEIEWNSKYEEVFEGCNFELTALHARNQTWYSVGFEAFGSIETVEQNLLQAVREVMLHSSFPPMEGKNSFGYPEWLKRVTMRNTSSIDIPK